MKIYSVTAAIAIKDEELVVDSCVCTTKEEAENRVNFLATRFDIFPKSNGVVDYEYRRLDNIKGEQIGYSINARDKDGDEFTLELQQHDI
jgi:hypothetical protein